MPDDLTMDWSRAERTGLAEAIFCMGKSAAQIDAAVALAVERGCGLLLTRLEPERFAALAPIVRQRLDYDPLSRTGILAGAAPRAAMTVRVGIVAAGSSDMPVVGEAARTLAFYGVETRIVADVGVAGLWRLMRRLPEIEACPILIAVAGMEGALFSVLAGLVKAPVIAVPTSIGYGAAQGGRAALSSALASCAPGLVVVNIDNGYGAACAALKIAEVTARTARPPAPAAE